MGQWDINNIVNELQTARNEWRTKQKSLKDFGGRELPSKEEIKKIMNLYSVLHYCNGWLILFVYPMHSSLSGAVA